MFDITEIPSRRLFDQTNVPLVLGYNFSDDGHAGSDNIVRVLLLNSQAILLLFRRNLPIEDFNHLQQVWVWWEFVDGWKSVRPSRGGLIFIVPIFGDALVYPDPCK
jgi:hypothetical protein